MIITRRGLLLALLVLTAATLQVSVFDRIYTPRARPDLLLVVVAAVGFVTGRSTGAVTGFAAGLLADVMPPADHTVGVMALTYTTVGYLAGRLEDRPEQSVLTVVVAIALLSVTALLVAAGLGLMTGEPGIHLGLVAAAAPLVALYDVVLAPFVVPPVVWLVRRSVPDVDRT
ncbi:MAG: rod shape-determining protein MreD [Mycobacteriales bacterium]